MTGSLPHQRERGDVAPPRHWWRPRASDQGGYPPARSALGLRTVLATFGLLFCGVCAGLFAAGGQVGAAAVLALLALVAVVDLVVIGRRLRRRARSGQPPA
jgi:hypothetical protein